MPERAHRAGRVPLVSVVIAAFDADRYLAETLDSVMAQDHPALDVVVVDDGSTDSTPEIAQSYGDAVTYFAQPNRGLPAAQNQGLALATGDYLSFVDADDLWVPEKTRSQLAVLEANPDVDMVFGHVEQFASASDDEGGAPEIPDELRMMPGYSTGTLLISRSAFERVGTFAENLNVGPFIDWYLRAREHGLREYLMDDVVMRRRVHGGNMGVRLREQRSDYLRIIKAALDRRGSTGESAVGPS